MKTIIIKSNKTNCVVDTYLVPDHVTMTGETCDILHSKGLHHIVSHSRTFATREELHAELSQYPTKVE